MGEANTMPCELPGNMLRRRCTTIASSPFCGIDEKEPVVR